MTEFQSPDDPRPTYPQQGFPSAPPYREQPHSGQPYSDPSVRSWRDVPTQLRPVIMLLLVNLCLSILLTVVTLVDRHGLVTYQLDHRHITDAAQRTKLRDSYGAAIIGRVVGNIVVSVVYVFLVRALVRGRRWAYRRVIWVGGAGIVGLLIIQATPYPIWMRGEQLVQALVLAGLLYFVLQPDVRAHFASGLPGRDVRRFGGRRN